MVVYSSINSVRLPNIGQDALVYIIPRTLQMMAFGLNLDSLLRKLKRGYVILLYHSVPLKTSCIYDVEKDYFEKHLDHLKKKYELLSVAAIVEDIRENRHYSTLKVGITFDDGYKNNYEIAYPLLKEYEIPATIFLSTKYISDDQNDSEKNSVITEHFEGKQMLNWSEVREMKENGIIDIGAHTHTHRDLTSLSKQDALREVKTSKKILEDELATRIELFSFPEGSFNECVLELVRSSGYKGAFTSEARINPPNQNPYRIGRIFITSNDEALPYFATNVCGFREDLSRIYRALTSRVA